MAVLTNAGRVVLAQAVKARGLRLAWGSGDERWGPPPPPPMISATGLRAEIGRGPVDCVAFCVPDARGAIVVPGGRFRVSPRPSNNLYVTATVSASGRGVAVIRELGLFVGGGGGRRPADKDDSLLVLEHTIPIGTTRSTPELFEFVVTF